MSFVSLICGILTLVASWMIFKKMGHQGWEGIVPFYNTYVLCQELYGSGWKFLLLLIPLYNIYFVIKMQIDLAKAFNQGAGFGIGLMLWRMWSTRPRTPSPAATTAARSSDSADQVKKTRGAAPLVFYFAMFYLPK